MQDGLVSTIIPVKNRPRMLRESVASVLAQTYRPLEIIIVDDGSTDETGRVADELAAGNPGVVQALHQEASGAGPAREAGRVKACGEFIQYLDSDDLLLPEKFALQVAALREHPACDIAYGITSLVDDNGKVLEPVFKWTGRNMERLFPALLVDRWWCTHTPLYRRTLTDRIGEWSSLRYSQDWIYDVRAGALGAKLVHVDQPVSQHRHHTGERQIGSGKWLDPAGQAIFFEALYQGALQDGVDKACPEMKHFARWVFSAARKAAMAGDDAASEKLLMLAVTSAVTPSRDMQWFRRLVRVAGWRRSAVLLETLHRWSGRRTGASTLAQSWMTNP